MSRSHFGWVVALCVAIAFAAVQPALSQQPPLPRPAVTQANAEKTIGCTYYLGELAYDPNFGNWIANTIPDIIQPGSWDQPDHLVRCYGPARILVVKHTPAVQKEVDAFLKSLKAALPTEEKTDSTLTKSTASPGLTRAQYAAPNVLPTSDAAGAKPYPVPPAAVQPKHLFHFIIRYEGDGLIDASLAELLVKAVNGEATSTDEKAAQAQADARKQLGQLFHIIVRYEGDGLIDSTIAGLVKHLYAGKILEQVPGLGPIPMTPPPPSPDATPPLQKGPPAYTTPLNPKQPIEPKFAPAAPPPGTATPPPAVQPSPKKSTSPNEPPKASSGWFRSY